MFSEFVSASQSIKVLGEILRSASDLKNYNEVAAALAKVNEALLAAQASAMQSLEKNTQLLQEVKELKEQLEKAQAWQDKASSYKLVKTAAGGMVMSFSGEPAHFVCPRCFENHKIHILQDLGVYSGDFRCPECKNAFSVNIPKQVNVIPHSYNPYG